MGTKHDANPYGQVYSALADAVFGANALGAVVRPANVVRFDGSGRDNPARTSRADAHTPEAVLVPAGVTLNPHASSTMVEAVLLFRLEVLSRNLRVQQSLYPLLWGLTVGVAAADDNLGLDFVLRVSMESDVSAELGEPAGESLAWQSVATIRVECGFDRATVKTGIGKAQ